MLGVLLTVSGSVSCADAPATAPIPDGAPSAVRWPAANAQSPFTLDDYFEEVAHVVPSFGGAYRSHDGRLRILLTDPRDADNALAALRDYVDTSRFAGPALTDADPVFVMAEYDWARLAEWRRRARPLLALPGVVYLDIDETTNRLRLGITADGTPQTTLDDQLTQLSVPPEAVNTETTTPVDRAATLRDRSRPAWGGVHIDVGATSSSCTLGFNAYLGLTKGFTTASHCTLSQGGEEGTVFHQNDNASGQDRVGVESSDPDYFTVSPCASGRRCRYSDIAFQAYDDTVATRDGRLARTTYEGHYSGSLTISSAHPFFVVRGEDDQASLFERLHKVGRTTGWTTGLVNGTCIDVNVNSSDVRLLCQYTADLGVGSGDSGAPVFGWHYAGRSEGDEVTLYGSLWGESDGGQKAWFSALGLIEYELGALNTTTDYEPLSVEIAGPTNVSIQGSYQWEADVAGGDDDYTYEWDYRTNHTTPTCTYVGPWISGGTSESMQVFVLVPGYEFQIRLRVTSDVEVEDEILFVNVSQYLECPEGIGG